MGQTCWNYFIKNATAALFFESQCCVMRNHMHASLSPRVSQTTTDVFWRLTITRSSAVAKRPRDASCHWIFCWVTRGHSKWHCWV